MKFVQKQGDGTECVGLGMTDFGRAIAQNAKLDFMQKQSFQEFVFVLLLNCTFILPCGKIFIATLLFEIHHNMAI